jgi:hypothetical protein
MKCHSIRITLPVGARFTFASPIEHEVVAQGDMGTTIRKILAVYLWKTVTDSSTGKSTRFRVSATDQGRHDE